MDVPTKLHMTQSYALKISGPGSWYSNVNGEHFQVWGIYRVRIYEGQYKYSIAVLSMGCIKWNIDDVVLKLNKDYIIHDGDYYSIVDKDKILLSLDEI